VADLRSGSSRFVPCDTLVFTGGWIPDHELARHAGLSMDPGTRGPAVDTGLQTSAAGIYAAGNLVHAAETADIAALSGRHAARHIATMILFSPVNALKGWLPVRAEPPLRWVSPNAIAVPPSVPPLGRFVLRSAEFRRLARLEVWQDGRLVGRSGPVRLIPGRPVHLGAAWLPRVDPSGGPVHVTT
jgi:NADPH-dependent 2,4-dienoyl-CoA reductase/sulfur reductase-like enzyme